MIAVKNRIFYFCFLFSPIWLSHTNRERTILAFVGIPGCFLTILLNLIVLIAFVRCSEVRRAPNLYILNLALCDFLVGLVCLPSLLSFGLYGCWPFGMSLCRFFIVVDWIVTPESAMTMVLIATDRFVMVRLGAQYTEKVSGFEYFWPSMSSHEGKLGKKLRFSHNISCNFPSRKRMLGNIFNPYRDDKHPLSSFSLKMYFCAIRSPSRLSA